MNPKKIPYFFPCVLIVGLVLFSHWIYFDDPLQFPSFYDMETLENKFDNVLHEKTGMGRFNLEIGTLGNRAFCIFFNPLHCLPEKTGDQFVDNWWFKALYNKIPLSIFGFGLLFFSPLGIFLLLRKYELQQKLILIGFLVGFLSSFIFYTSVFTFSSGGTPFFRYHIFWLPAFAIFSIHGLNFVYTKLRLIRIEK